jgi:hypothetical protein
MLCQARSLHIKAAAGTGKTFGALLIAMPSFPSVFRRNERSFAKTGSGQARKGGNVPIKEERFFGFFPCLCVCLAHGTVAMIFLLEKVRMRKTHDVFCGPFYTQNDASFCQDRLGTNI